MDEQSIKDLYKKAIRENVCRFNILIKISRFNAQAEAGYFYLLTSVQFNSTLIQTAIYFSPFNAVCCMLIAQERETG